MKWVGAAFAVESDPQKAAGLIVEQINYKRSRLGLPVKEAVLL